MGFVQTVWPYLPVQDGGHTRACATQIGQLLRSGTDRVVHNRNRKWHKTVTREFWPITNTKVCPTFSIIWNVVVFSEISLSFVNRHIFWNVVFWLSGPPYKCLPIYFTVGWKAQRKTDFLLPSRLSKVTLLRSSGAATPTVKGLLAMGSPPNFTTIVISPCRRTHHADPTRQQLLHFKSMWEEDRMRRNGYVGFLILLKTCQLYSDCRQRRAVSGNHNFKKYI